MSDKKPTGAALTKKAAPAPEQRERPIHHQGQAVAAVTILDEMEQAAQKRLSGGGRVALSPKLKLAWNNIDPAYNYQWASDSESYPVNLQQMCDAGYTFVRHEHGQQSGSPVVQHSRGCNLYLMRCPIQFFEEDQAKVHEKSIRQHQEVMEVGKREYAGESKELGKGKAVTMDFAETPSAIKLMEGD